MRAIGVGRAIRLVVAAAVASLSLVGCTGADVGTSRESKPAVTVESTVDSAAPTAAVPAEQNGATSAPTEAIDPEPFPPAWVVGEWLGAAGSVVLGADGVGRLSVSQDGMLMIGADLVVIGAEGDRTAATVVVSLQNVEVGEPYLRTHDAIPEQHSTLLLSVTDGVMTDPLTGSVYCDATTREGANGALCGV